jgi:hypothetical protein
MDNDIRQMISNQFGLLLQEGIDEHTGRKLLAEKLNQLIIHDFNHLVQVLYRVDVSEQSLKKTLLDHPNENAGDIIATMLIDRWEKSKKSRLELSRDENIAEEERW